jgi:hypothetical protein
MGQVAQDLHERALLDLDEKGEDIAFLATPEAMEKLALLMDVKRRSFLRVKWAKSFEAPGACALEFNVSLYDVNDIRTFTDVVNFLAWQQRQMKPTPNEKWVVVNNSHAERVKENLLALRRFRTDIIFVCNINMLQFRDEHGRRAELGFCPALAGSRPY